MLRVTVTGIFAATFFGTLIGIARLSKNYIVEKASTGLLEVVRNVPLLVQIFFFQAVICFTFPRLEVFDEVNLQSSYKCKRYCISMVETDNLQHIYSGYFLLSFSIG